MEIQQAAQPLKKQSLKDVAKIVEDRDIDAFRLMIIRQLQGDFYHLSTFLDVHRFEFSEKVPTAGITKDRLCYINPDFILKHAPTPEKCLMLVCHEVYHKIMRHIEIPKGYTENIAWDATINAMLCQIFKGGRYWSFFKDYYSPIEFPTMILRPNSRPKRFIDRRYYRMLYYKKRNITGTGTEADYMWGLTWEDVMDWLDRMAKEQMDEAEKNIQDMLNKGIGIPVPGGGILIGDHRSGKITQQDIDDAGTLLDIANEGLERLKSNTAGTGKFMLEEVIQELEARKSSKLVEAFTDALLQDASSKMAMSIKSSFPELPRQTIVPLGMSRFNILQLATGYLPVFWQMNVPDENKGSVYIYIDTSGSMGDWVKWCYELCVALEDWLAEPILLFSNQIAEINLRQLRQGFVSSTGGTDFDCIAEHALEKGYQKIIIITDGYASISQANADALKRKDIHLFTAFVPDSSGSTSKGKSHSILCEISDRYYELTEEDKIL